MGSKDRGIGFAVFVGKQNITKDELSHPVGSDEIRIAPVILGSKNGGVFNIILGAVLIAASFIPFLAPVAPYLLSTGVAMVAGGVAQLLTPMPKGLSAKDKPANTPNYSFNGPINTQA
jgi:predicted phage tail protein